MTSDPRERFSAGNRLRSSRDYATLKATGVAMRGRHCLLLVVARPGEISKAGFIASKKGVGGAVQRNRARRRLREIVRRRWARVPSTGYWFAFIAFRSALTATHQDLATDVERLLASAGALAPIGVRGE
jgi:ribonuclease P protein component